MQQNERESSNGPHGTGCGAGRGTPAPKASHARLIVAQLGCARPVADRGLLAHLLRDERERARAMAAVGARKGATMPLFDAACLVVILLAMAACAVGLWPWTLGGAW